MRRFLHTLPTFVAVVVALLAGTGTVTHAQTGAYPPRTLTVTLDADEVLPGGIFSVTLSGCLEGEIVDFLFAGARTSLACDLTVGPQALVASHTPLGGTTTRLVAPPTPGEFSGSVVVDGAPVGDFDVRVVSDAVEVVDAASVVEVVDAPLPSTSGGRGIGVFGPLLIALAMLGGGATFAKLKRR